MQRSQKLARLVAIIDELKQEDKQFSTASTRVKHDHWKKENKIFTSFMEKVVGSQVEDQSTFLMYHLQKLYPHHSFIPVCVNYFSTMKNYSTLSKGARKSRSNIYQAFDELLAKMSGTLDQTTQKNFLNARFRVMHHQDEEYEDLVAIPSWSAVMGNITSLVSGRSQTVYSEKTKEQLNSPNCRMRHKILEKMMNICAGSDSLSELFQMIDDRLASMTSTRKFSSWQSLGSLLETVQPPDEWRKEKRAFKSFVEKFLGSELPQDKAAFFLHQLRELYPGQTYISACVNDFAMMKDFSELSKNGRRSRSHIYRDFDKLLVKMCGSEDQKTQKIFLNARFKAMHIEEEDFEDLLPTLSWGVVLSNIISLEDEKTEETVYSKKTKKQLKKQICRIRHKALEKLMISCAGSGNLKELELMIEDRLIAILSKKKIYTWSRLHRLVEKMQPLTPFQADKKETRKNRYKYQTVKKIVNKASGYNSLEVSRQTKARTNFLQHLFPQTFQCTWEMLDEDKYCSSLKEKPAMHKYPIARTLLKLIEKFMGAGETSAFFEKYCDDVKLTLKDPILLRLKALGNAMAEVLEREKGQKGRNLRFISNLYSNLLSCIVSLGRKGTTFDELKTEGWKLTQSRYSFARKRQREEEWTEIRPKKRGRVSISEELQQRIRQVWVDNSRAAANLLVKDPNGGPKRPGSRLIVPALQVALHSGLVKTKFNPDGLVSLSTFHKYRPFWVKSPSLKDGLCHQCMRRRALIKSIHGQFKKTDPDYECKDREENKGWHLELWKSNSPKYPTVKMLLKKFDPLCDHALRKDKKLRAEIDKNLVNLTSLERHFRLAMAYLKRGRSIENDFNKVFGPEWLRITNDAKNPLVIGRGGLEEMGMSTAQKRSLGICSCVGTMVEYSDPKGGKAPKRAYVSNLSRNTDKSSYAALEHLIHSLHQSPIKELLEDKSKTKVEISHDNASNYKSKEFLYGCTKTLSKMYPHLKVIQWVPLAPLHGKTNLDRRFSSFTSWINTFQLSKRIGTVKQMEKVLKDGAEGSNLRRLEVGDDPIPTSFNILRLKNPPLLAPYVEVEAIKSLQCVTYIADKTLRLSRQDSGFYINVYPWIAWHKGKKIPNKDVKEGRNSRVRTEKQLKLANIQKPAGPVAKIKFDRLLKQHENRAQLLKELGLNVKLWSVPQN